MRKFHEQNSFSQNFLHQQFITVKEEKLLIMVQ